MDLNHNKATLEWMNNRYLLHSNVVQQAQGKRHIYHLDDPGHPIQITQKSIVFKCHILTLPTPGFVIKFTASNNVVRELQIADKLPPSNFLTYVEDSSGPDGYLFQFQGRSFHLHFVICLCWEGGDLFDFTQSMSLQCTKVPMNFAVAAFGQILRGLSDLHAKRIVHSDIKLDNLLWNGNYNDPRFVITDFDLAIPVETVSDAQTPEYAAPEVRGKGAVAVQSRDIYSFGVTMFSLLTGAMPEYREGIIWNWPTDTPTDFATLIGWMMAFHPDQRPTAFDLLKILGSNAKKNDNF
jgi:serine/threonine protein kinase